jgi:hypothetical protein
MIGLPASAPPPPKPKTLRSAIVGAMWALVLLALGLGGFVALLGLLRRLILFGWASCP